MVITILCFEDIVFPHIVDVDRKLKGFPTLRNPQIQPIVFNPIGGEQEVDRGVQVVAILGYAGILSNGDPVERIHA